ncbi:MAG: hypothetical protein JSW04_14495 [Desulfobacterales bacterium]|nr:MAG: hypothetical protein JSW04_14495 [Desulfobacterales bacterium]
MILFAVFLLSLSALSFEVLLTRVFSIGQWNHLSFMVISIALFGFAASGTFLNIIDTRNKGWEKRLSQADPLLAFVILYSLTAIIAYVVLNQIPFDYFRLPLESIQIFYLLMVYLLLALPFFFTGLVVILAYAANPEKTGLVYFSNMSGSAFGAIIPFLFLPLLGEGNLIIFSALVPLLIVPLKTILPEARHPSFIPFLRERRMFFRLLCFSMVIIAGLLVTIGNDTLISVKPSPYKALSQALQLPNTITKETTTGIRGRFDSIDSPYIRFAPGLSLKYTKTLPDTWMVFTDGDSPFYFYTLQPEQNEQFSRFTLCYLGYLLAPNPAHVLIIQRGGGLGIPCALAAKASNITIIEQQPRIAQLVKHHYDIDVTNKNHRTFLRQSDKKFHVIHVENWGSSLPGSSALAQEHLFTSESITAYLHHLSNNGVLIISRKLLLPPADLIRLWAVVYESLISFGIENPEQHIAVLRNWNTYTLMVSAKRLNDTQTIQDFARNLNFDLVYIPGITKEMANRFNIFDSPYHYFEIKRLAEAYRLGTQKTYFDTYLLDVAAQTDNRPFPGRFLKWSKLKTLYQMTGSRFYSLFMSGEVVVAVVFFEAFFVTIFLLVIPLMAISKTDQRPYFSSIIYFLGVGAGFMFIELFFIKKYTFIFGDPVISFAVVLSGILIFSSLGGYASQHLDSRYLRHILVALVAVLILILFGLDSLDKHLLGLSQNLQYTTAFLLLLPPGIIAGFPFPLGMRYLVDRPSHRAYAWAANGCASVLASVGSAQIALSLGITTIIACAAFAYLLACVCIFQNSARV